MTPPRCLFVIASAREGGSTELLARHAAAALPAEAEQTWLRLRDLRLSPFQDLRHDGDGQFRMPEGPERILLEATLAATDIVIASPLYWYNLSADAKLYLDYWSGWTRVAGLDFRDRMRGKRMWAVTAQSTGDEAAAAPLLQSLRLTAAYLGMDWGGELLGRSYRPGDLLDAAETLQRAEAFFGGVLQR